MLLRMMNLAALVLPLAAMVSTAAAGDAPASQPVSVRLKDLSGIERRPLDPDGAKAIVIIFISADCPISNGYAPEINRLCKTYQDRAVRFYLVHVDSSLTTADAAKHAGDYGFCCPVLIDRAHELSGRLGARVTPEAAIISPDGQIAYRGRIDDLYIALGKARYRATTHDLITAIDAVLTHQPLANPRTQAVGCAIPES